MPGFLAYFTTAEVVTLFLLAVLIALIAVMAVRAWRHARLSPQERERRRRAVLAASGKMGDGNLLDLQGHFLLYSYEVRGVEYVATQDVSTLNERLPEDFSALVGPVAIKYEAANPANSIVLAEEWSGLRAAGNRKLEPRT